MLEKKTLEDVTIQDDEAMSDNSDNDKRNDDKSSHTNTRTGKKKIAPIVVLGAEFNAVQQMLLTTVTDKKLALRITVIGHRIDLIDANDFMKVKATLDDMVKAGKVVGFYSYHTLDTRPHNIMLFGLYKLERNDLKEKLKQSGVTPTDISTIKMGQQRDRQTCKSSKDQTHRHKQLESEEKSVSHQHIRLQIEEGNILQ